MAFCTVINCMDGRTQLPAIEYLKKRFNVEYVDSITEPGPDGILAAQTNTVLIDSIINRIEISVKKHKSVGMAVISHHDCAGNPVDKEEHLVHMEKSVQFLKSKYDDLPIIGLWIDGDWTVHEIIKDE